MRPAPTEKLKWFCPPNKYQNIQMTFKYQKNSDGEFICPYCEETRKNQNTMHYHLKKHEGALPHQCKHCDKKFLHKNMLELHIQARHPDLVTKKEKETKKEFKCPYDSCDFTSLTKANRIIHFMRIHCKDLTALAMKKTVDDKVGCDHCKKEFNNSTAFYYHSVSCCQPQSSLHKAYEPLKQILAN